MQTISETYANLLKTNEFIYDQAPLVYITVDSTELIPVTKFSLSRENDTLAESCNIQIANVNPDDPSDTGYYNWQRDVSTHNKPSNSWLGVIIPGKTVVVKAGYGDNNISDTVNIFTGIIDTVKINIDNSGNASMNIISRGMTKKLVDRKIKQYNSTTAETLYYMTYPVESSDIDTTGYELTYADTDPYLYEIWEDVCKRAGYDDADIHTNTDCTLKLSDIDADSFINIKGTWANLAKQIVDLMFVLDGGTYVKFYQKEDENGDIYLNKDYDISWIGSGNITFSGTDWHSLSTFQGGSNYRAVENSIVIDSYTVADGEFEFDYAGNKVRRTDGSSIADGSPVAIYYTYCAWVFIPNQLYKIKEWTSHDDISGTILATNNDLGLSYQLAVGALSDGSEVSADKVYEIDIPELNTSALLGNWATAKKTEMRKSLYNLKADIVPIPHLRVRDIVCCLLYGTVKELYEITGLNFNYEAEKGFSQSLKAIYYNLSDVIAPTNSYLITADGDYLLDSSSDYLLEP